MDIWRVFEHRLFFLLGFLFIGQMYYFSEQVANKAGRKHGVCKQSLNCVIKTPWLLHNLMLLYSQVFKRHSELHLSIVGLVIFLRGSERDRVSQNNDRWFSYNWHCLCVKQMFTKTGNTCRFEKEHHKHVKDIGVYNLYTDNVSYQDITDPRKYLKFLSILVLY